VQFYEVLYTPFISRHIASFDLIWYDLIWVDSIRFDLIWVN
jgi:hypothetical protein